jgi:hypothetical protein
MRGRATAHIARAPALREDEPWAGHARPGGRVPLIASTQRTGSQGEHDHGARSGRSPARWGVAAAGLATATALAACGTGSTTRHHGTAQSVQCAYYRSMVGRYYGGMMTGGRPGALMMGAAGYRWIGPRSCISVRESASAVVSLRSCKNLRLNAGLSDRSNGRQR